MYLYQLTFSDCEYGYPIYVYHKDVKTSEELSNDFYFIAKKNKRKIKANCEFWYFKKKKMYQTSDLFNKIVESMNELGYQTYDIKPDEFAVFDWKYIDDLYDNNI